MRLIDFQPVIGIRRRRIHPTSEGGSQLGIDKIVLRTIEVGILEKK